MGGVCVCILSLSLSLSQRCSLYVALIAISHVLPQEYRVLTSQMPEELNTSDHLMLVSHLLLVPDAL